jgi:hypothetical protein
MPESNPSLNQLPNDSTALRMNVVVFSLPKSTTLSVAVTAAQNTIPAVGAGGDARSRGVITVAGEIVEYTGLDVATDTFTGCTRGAQGTVAAAHAAGAIVQYSRATPAVTRAAASADLDAFDERLAQSAMRLDLLGVDMGGVGDPGVALPAALLPGFVGSPGDAVTFTLAERAVIALKSGNQNTVDVFYVQDIDHDPTIFATVYPTARNSSGGEPDGINLVIVAAAHRAPTLTSAEVVHRIETYFEGSSRRYSARLSSSNVTGGHGACLDSADDDALTEQNANILSERVIRRIPPYPGTFTGRGVVMCAGGLKYFTCAWVSIKMLRRLGCSLPIQMWFLGEDEFDDRMKALVAPLGVECVDAFEVRKRHPCRILNGWELKPYAILHAPFQEVLFVDADNIAVRNPEYLFETPQFAETGAIFWPDAGRFASPRIWDICGIPHRDEPEFETGQIVIDKQRCWRALSLSMWFNEHSDFYYRYIYGDKDTFHLAFRKLNQHYSMPTGVLNAEGILYQHDFNGDRIFQHLCARKWDLKGSINYAAGFLYEDECKKDLELLRNIWSGRINVNIYDSSAKS